MNGGGVLAFHLPKMSHWALWHTDSLTINANIKVSLWLDISILFLSELFIWCHCTSKLNFINFFFLFEKVPLVAAFSPRVCRWERSQSWNVSKEISGFFFFFQVRHPESFPGATACKCVSLPEHIMVSLLFLWTPAIYSEFTLYKHY